MKSMLIAALFVIAASDPPYFYVNGWLFHGWQWTQIYENEAQV